MDIPTAIIVETRRRVLTRGRATVRQTKPIANFGIYRIHTTRLAALLHSITLLSLRLSSDSLATMGKSQSKLSPEQIQDLTKNTYCSFYSHINYFILTDHRFYF